ncbi:MAG: M56 family metallopeptidase [Akkermansiaceae bacterium]|nr:M56 family metallopeptidase [Akkermansiaceae bacterium]MCF7733394.1 M56 family metallopeptidase [Akkermansiaceae bacterium]
MNVFFAQTIGFSLVALAVLRWVERRGGVGLAGLQRMALVWLLVYPLLGWLPKWHVLPAAAAATGGGPVAVDGTGAGGWLLGLWLAGSVVQSVRLGLALRRLAAWRAEALPLIDPAELELAGRCAVELGLRRRVELRVGPAMAGAAACGIWRPLVLLPRDWHRWNAETKRAVLLHELGHHASWDPLWRMISLGAAIIYWFNPLVWWLAAKLQTQAEFACDARVVGCGFRADRYAHILCDLASRAPTTVMALAAPRSLEQRVRMLHSRRGVVTPLLLGTAAGVLACFALGLAILRSDTPPGTAGYRPNATPTSQSGYTPEEIETRHQAEPFPAD